jgi:hypothetical protein
MPEDDYAADCPRVLSMRAVRARDPGIRTSPLFQKGVRDMIVKECFGCGNVTAHQHVHDCAHDIPETHMAGSERFVCELCEHVTFAGSDGASRFPFTFDKVAAGR